MNEFTVTIKVKALSQSVADGIGSNIQAIATNIESKNLEVLAKKSKKPGINKKIQQFKSMI